MLLKGKIKYNEMGMEYGNGIHGGIHDCRLCIYSRPLYVWNSCHKYCNNMPNELKDMKRILKLQAEAAARRGSLMVPATVVMADTLPLRPLLRQAQHAFIKALKSSLRLGLGASVVGN